MTRSRDSLRRNMLPARSRAAGGSRLPHNTVVLVNAAALWYLLFLCIGGSVGLASLAGCTEQAMSWDSSPQTSGSTGRRNIFQRQPDGERWIIECMTARGPQHKQTIERHAELLRGVKGIRARNVSVVHDESESKLHYGSYRVESTGAFSPELNRDIQLIRQLAPANSPTRRPFAAARRIPETGPDVGPSEWNLRNVDATYSLQIAVFYNQAGFQKRKPAAVEYCRYWREKGYQAFYYHGPTRSHTTVGAFGPDAVRYVDGRPRYGKEVLDFIAKEELFTWNLDNNTKRHRIVDGTSTQQKSFLVKNPKNETDGLE